MPDNKRMGSTSVDASVLGVRFADGTYQKTSGVPVTDVFGNSIVSDATGITLTDTFGNMFQMTNGAVFFTVDGSGGGFSMFFDGTNYGAGMSDGNGNALLLGDGFGNLNLSNASGHAGIISTSGDTCFVYGNPLFIGVAGGNGLTINTTDITFNCPLVLQTAVPASATAAGVAGQIAWDSSRLYLCVAPNTWLRSAVMTTW
jgi:hypothetical protein